MSSTSRGYHIVAPEYRHNSAGIRALYILADELRARGYRATTGFTARDPDDIVLYPEVCPENVFKSERAVWWLLNDAVVPQPAWAWTEGISNDPLLTVNVIELDLFKPRTGPRSGVVWWAHKGGYSERHVPPGAVRITHDWPPTREELADLIAGAQVLISFDGFTSMNAEAALLGTPVVCVMYSAPAAVVCTRPSYSASMPPHTGGMHFSIAPMGSAESRSRRLP